MRFFCSLFAVVVLIAGLSACGSTPRTGDAGVRFTEAPSPSRKGDFPNWPAPPQVIEEQVQTAFDLREFEVMEEQQTARGTAGAEKVTMYFPSARETVTFKWKEAPKQTLDGSNNSPRREVTAYEVQKLFLEPEDYVVPTTLIHCDPLAEYAQDHPNATATLRGTRCVLGGLSVWLQDVTIPEPLFDGSRFATEPPYAYYMSNFNLLTYLIGHRDGREGNFVVSKDETRPQLFSIDNGISMKAFPYNFFVTNWDAIRIPAVRRASIDRLRTLGREDLDHLAVLVQLEKDDKGRLVDVAPGKNLSPSKGVRVRNGTVQFGMSQAELEELWARIQAVIAEVDSGDLPVF